MANEKRLFVVKGYHRGYGNDLMTVDVLATSFDQVRTRLIEDEMFGDDMSADSFEIISVERFDDHPMPSYPEYYDHIGKVKKMLLLLLRAYR